MDRRLFITGLGSLGFVIVGCRSGSQATNHLLDETVETERISTLTDLTIFAFFQGFAPNQTMTALNANGEGRNTGTVTSAQLASGEPVVMRFWHGHGGRDHTFTITTEQIEELKQGRTVRGFTTEVDGHKHAFQIVPKFRQILDIKMFAYFQAFLPGTPGQTIDTAGEGTEVGILSASEIAAGSEIQREFWHGHNGEQHTFKITTAHLASLRAGNRIYVPTTVVDGHYHVILIDPARV